MKNKKIILIVKSIASLTIITFLISKLDLDTIRALNIRTVLFIGISATLTFLSLLLIAKRWQIIINTYSSIKAEIKYLLSFYLIGTFFNLLLPGIIGGDITRVHNSNKKYKLGIKKAGTIVLAERIIGTLGTFLIFAIGVALTQNKSVDIGISLNKTITALCILIFLTILGKNLIQNKIKIEYRTFIPILLLSMISQFGDIISATIFFKLFQLNIGFKEAILIMPLTYFATMIPLSLGGLGIREGTMAGLAVLLGVSSSIAVTIPLLMYFSKITIGGIGGIVYLKYKHK